MLKLPKGLKKKKKGKKSKKDQELFTEEELEQYKREHQIHQQQPEGAEANGSEQEAKGVTSGGEEQASTAAATASVAEDDEWSKFKALTAGVDSILHKTQDDLDRIKSTSFFKRVPPPSERKKAEEEQAAQREAEKLVQEKLKKEEQEANRDKLAEAVVELSESEEESEEADDIFDTGYIDAITSGEVQFAIVPDSPEFEVDDGPDPFDTSYADKLIKGPEVSKRGKKLVSIGSAVEVLTGRVDSVQVGRPRRPRRGPQDLLLENFDEDPAALAAGTDADLDLSVTPEPPKTLLDDPADELPDIPIDLSVSLHLSLQKEKQDREEAEEGEEGKATQDTTLGDTLAEFDVLKADEDDEFAELAAESLVKKEDVKVITQAQPLEFSGEVQADWAEFEQVPEEEQPQATKAKPPRPPPVRPATGPGASEPGVLNVSDDEFEVPDDDPFDTTFVEKVLPGEEDEDDFDFDPRAEEKQVQANPVVSTGLDVVERDLLGGSNPDLTTVDPVGNLLTATHKDLLGGSNSDLSTLPEVPIVPTQGKGEVAEEDFDPFDTSAVTRLVQPKETELKFLEKELLTETSLKHSLSDPDFDPRADDFEAPAVIAATPKKVVSIAPAVSVQPSVQFAPPTVDFDTARRKSSLSLNIQHKSVVFLVPDTDLLGANQDGGKHHKPLTPYYSKEVIPEKSEDPFDTSFVPDSKPTTVELSLIEQDLLASTNLQRSLSDPDFDPRAHDEFAVEVPKVSVESSDLLAAVENPINIKVLTPALESKLVTEEDDLDRYADPFDTSHACNILPGKTELKLIENELLPATTPVITTGVLDTLTDAQELGLGDKVLTPQVQIAASSSIEDVDPFDTSFAENLGPGKTEIKIIENELIQQ